MTVNDSVATAIPRRSALQLAALLGAAAVAPAALAGCSDEDDALALTATDLTAPAREAASFSIAGEDVRTILTDERTRAASYALAANLLRTCSQADTAQDAHANTFISPLSILFALALAQNGAAGTTLDELADYPVIVDSDLDYFNESILATYVKRGVRSERFTPKTKEDMLEHFMKRQGYAFSVAHEALADSKLGNTIIPIDPADAVDIPICLVTPKGVENPLCKKAVAAFTGKAPL